MTLELQFVYFGNNRWVRSRYLPRQYRNYDLYNGYKVVLNGYHGNRPYAHYRNHRQRYSANYRNHSQRSIGDTIIIVMQNNHRRSIIGYTKNRRYSNDHRYAGNHKSKGKHANKETMAKSSWKTLIPTMKQVKRSAIMRSLLNLSFS
jgi:hypothetical protein